MIKKILIISPEFNEEFVLYQPWRQIFELGISMKRKGLDFTIGSNSTNKNEIKELKILYLDQKELRVLTSDSKNKILQIKPDVILWMGNPLSGKYLKKNFFEDIPIVLYISTIQMTWKEIKNLTIKEIFQSNFVNFLTSFPPFSNLVKNLNHNNISGIITANQTIKNRLISLGVIEHKIKVTPLCFESNFNHKSIQHMSTSTKTFTICYLGPIFSIRGVDLLLDVVALLKKSNFLIHLDFLLRTTTIQEDKSNLIEKCKSRGILDLVKIDAGILDRKFVFETILNSDAVVLPTKFVWNEPPLAILETMILGKPVITTNVCGLPELVEGRGIILNPDKKSFHDEIIKLANDRKKLSSIGEKGMEFVKSLPGWDYLADWFIATLEQFLQDFNKKSKYE